MVELAMSIGRVINTHLDWSEELRKNFNEHTH
jgi:hypothetical protein